jgi:two-component system, OmpR family, response regulator
MENSPEPDFSSQAFAADSPPLKPIPNSVAKGKGRILVVDDDPNSTHLVKVLLERSGPYEVMEVNDATAAHETARSFKPDLILLDILMPKIDGGELAAQIQADHELHDTPIIFLTALVTTDEAKSGVHIEGHSAVAKPINIPELIDAIKKHLPARAEC